MPCVESTLPYITCPLTALQDVSEQFVRVEGTRFVLGCETFYVSGWNQWEAIESGAGALKLYGGSIPEHDTAPEVWECVGLAEIERGWVERLARAAWLAVLAGWCALLKLHLCCLQGIDVLYQDV